MRVLPYHKLVWLFVLLLAGGFGVVPDVGAASLTSIVAERSSSEISTGSNWELTFILDGGTTVIENETIILTLASGDALGEFFDTSAITVADIDVEFSTSTDATLAAVPSATDWGVAITNGAASTDAVITLTAPSTVGTYVTGGETVTVEIGSNAAGGSNQIINPALDSTTAAGGNLGGSSENRYQLALTGTFGDTGLAILPVLSNEGVTVSANVPDNGQGSSGGSSGSRRSRDRFEQAQIELSGRAYPNAPVTILRDGVIAATTTAGSDGFFSATLSGLPAATHTISLYASDPDDNQSILQTYFVPVQQNSVVTVEEIFIPGTLERPSSPDNSSVPSDQVTLSGSTFPNSIVMIFVNGAGTQTIRTASSDEFGRWTYNLDLAEANPGTYVIQLKTSADGYLSTFSRNLRLEVGENEVAVLTRDPRGDVNGDGRVDLVDFSIAAFWFQQPLNANLIEREFEQLSGDGEITLQDFSIMAFYWTG